MRNTLLHVAFVLIIASCANESSTNQSTPTTDTTKKDDAGQVIKITRVSDIDTAKKSIKAYVANNINGNHITITYHSPAVRNRTIWGGLVPFNQPWVTGAHMATTIETESDLIINKTTIPAGKYALFTIPTNSDWTVIINKNWQQHLTDEYDAKDDLLRVITKPDSLDYTQERLMYEIDQTGEYKASIEFRWEKLRFRLPLEIKH